MSLRTQFNFGAMSDKASVATGLVPGSVRTIDNQAYRELKARLHQTLLDRINLKAMENLGEQQLKEELKRLVQDLLKS
ncbi:MAG: hypothetical protein ACM3UM_00075, partial [Nitrososphaerales archaeon]